MRWYRSCFAFSAFVLFKLKVGNHDEKRTVGWIKDSSQKAEAVSALLPLEDQPYYAYLVKGSRLPIIQLDPLHILLTDYTAPPLSTILSFHYNTGRVDSFPSITPLLCFTLYSFHSIDVHLLADRRADTSLSDQQPTLLYPATPFKPLETGLSLV